MSSAVERPPPAIDVIPSEEIIQYLHPSLLSLDYSDPGVKMSLVGVSFLFFAVVFVFSMILCSSFRAFRSLKLKHRVFMALAIVRGIFGFAGTVLGTYSVIVSTNLDRDVVYGRTATSAFAVYLTVGFLAFELGAVIISDLAFRTFSKMLITHHSMGLIAYCFAMTLEANYSFGCRGLLLEMSTPFSCLCYVLLKAGMESSKLWWLNQIVLVHTFHLRSMVEMHLWFVTYKHWANIWAYMPGSIFYLLYTNLVLVTFIMTPYWGYKKTQQLFNPIDWNFQEAQNGQENHGRRENHKKMI